MEGDAVKIVLMQHWGAMPPGEEVSVSPDRAKYLVEIGYARWPNGQPPDDAEAETEADTPAPSRSTKKRSG